MILKYGYIVMSWKLAYIVNKIDLYSHNYRHIYIKSVLVNDKRGLYLTISRWLKTILKKAEWRLLWENILVRMVFVVKQM